MPESGFEWEAQLRQDPAGVFPACDKQTQDRYRLAVIELAERWSLPPARVAQAALDLAHGGPQEHPELRHVGYYLVDDGQPQLAALCAPDAPAAATRRASLLRLNLLLALAGTVPAAWLYGVAALPPALAFAMTVALALVAYDYATNLAHRIIGARTPGRWLPTLDFVRPGLSRECRTLIAVPCLLVDKAQVDEVLAAQAWNYRAANDEQARIALLADFPDSATGVDQPAERELLAYTEQRVRALNAALGDASAEPVMLLHRDRVHSRTQSAWIGRERKRGKLDALNRLISGESTEWRLLCGNMAWLQGVRYVLCLDEDSRLARDAVQLLAGAMAHPLNRAVVAPDTGAIARGHALLVPILRTSAAAAGRWRLGSVIAGPAADARAPVVAMRDFHFDHYRATHYPGKGLYEVSAYRAACEGRIPDERVLSHDTLEGAWLNPGFCGRALVVEGFPSTQRQLTLRQLRWIAGDWQNLFYLAGSALRNGRASIPGMLGSIVLNQVRISLTPVCLVSLIAVAIGAGAPGIGRRLLAVCALLLAPLYARALHSWVREPAAWLKPGAGNFGALRSGHLAAFYRVLRAPLDALVGLHACLLAAWRTLSGRGLLQWRAAALLETFDAARSPVPGAAWACSALACAALAWLWDTDRFTWTGAALLALWMLLPLVLRATQRGPGPDNMDTGAIAHAAADDARGGEARPDEAAG